jgi:hypothetical protein
LSVQVHGSRRVVNAEELPRRKGSEFGSQVPNKKSRETLVFDEAFGVFGFTIGKVVLMTVREPNIDNVVIGFGSEVNVLGIATPIVWDPLAVGVVSL